MFEARFLALLKAFIEQPPPDESHWYGPWNGILTHFLRSDLGYVVTPVRKVYDTRNRFKIPDFVVERAPTNSQGWYQRKIVLIVEIKNTRLGDFSTSDLEKQLLRATEAIMDVELNRPSLVYYIGAIGPSWCCGIKRNDGQELKLPQN